MIRFDARPVVPRRWSWRHLVALGALTTVVTLLVLSGIQFTLRERAGEQEDAALLTRRLFYQLAPGEPVFVNAPDISDRLIASLVIRNIAPRTEVTLRLRWHDRAGNVLAETGWRRPVAEKEAAIGEDSLERYLTPEGRPLAGPRNLTLRAADQPPGTDRISFTLVEPAGIDVFARFYTRSHLQPGAVHQASVLLEARERRLEARTALPSVLAPQELLERLTGWKWITVAAEGKAQPVHLFRRDLRGVEDPVDPAMEPPRVAGLRVGPGKPLAFEIETEGAYELRVIAAGSGAEVEIEKRVPGRLPEGVRAQLREGESVWADHLRVPTTLVVKKPDGGQAEVRLVYRPPGDEPELWVTPVAAPAVTWLVGPVTETGLLRVRAAGESGSRLSAVEGGVEGVRVAPASEAPGSESLRFEWSPAAAGTGASMRFRIRVVHSSLVSPPSAVWVRYRALGAGRLAVAEERIEVPLGLPDLERVPEGWSTAVEGSGLPVIPDRGEPRLVTGAGELYVEVPDEARHIELRAELPILVIPSVSLPLMRPTLAVPEESPDRSLCHIDPAPVDDARLWHYLRPTNEPELRAAGAAVVVELPDPVVRAPLRGAVSADAVWDREAAMPDRHAGSALALWPARPRGAISKNRLFPWNAPWPESAYRPVQPGESPPRVLDDPGLPDPADLLVEQGDGLLARVPWVEGPWPATTRFIDRPRPDDPDPDPRFALILRRAWRALPDVPAAFPVTHDGSETWVSLNAQFEGERPGTLDIDIEAPPWAVRRRAWAGGRTEPRRRITGADAPGSRLTFLDANPPLAGCLVQARLRLGADLPAGDYVIRISPRDTGAWLSMGVSRLGGRALVSGTSWTFRTEGLGGSRLGIDTPGRDPSRDVRFEAIVPGRGSARLLPEPQLDHWTIALPADCVALRAVLVSAGPGPVLVTIERPGAPKPLPLSASETRDFWRQLVPGIDDVYRKSVPGDETVRFRLLWEAPGEGSLPPESIVEASVSGPGGRTPLAVKPRWVRDPRVFDADRPGAVLWSSRPIEVVMAGSEREAAVRAWSDGLWVEWQRLAGPPAHVAIHTQGALDAFPYSPFLTRTRRGTGLWDDEPRPPYLWPERETWTTPWEHGTGISQEVPELPLAPSDLTVAGVTEQLELARPAAWRKPDNRPGPIWRAVPLGQEVEATVGDALGRARFASVRLAYEDVSIEAAQAATVQVWLDGKEVLTETLSRTRGELSIPGLTAGVHRVLLRPGKGVPAFRCGRWRVRTVGLPREGDWQVSAVWTAAADGEVAFDVPEPREGEQVILEILARERPGTVWGRWDFGWERRAGGAGEGWVALSDEHHWVAPGSGNDSIRFGADGAQWVPSFRMAWELDRHAGAEPLRGRLRGPVRKGDAVHLYRMALQGSALGDVDEVQRK